MGKKTEKEYPYDSTEAVEKTASKLSEICSSPESGAVILSRSPLLDSKDHDYGVGLPGNLRIIENNPAYIPNVSRGFATISSSSYLFIRALKAAGARDILLYMPALPLGEDLPPVVAIEDQIDMLSRPPHTGVDPAEWEERFFAMNKAYDIDRAMRALKDAGLQQKSGILLGVGPGQFDTPAGREAARRIGGNLMSVYICPQCLIAKRAGLNVTGFAETAGIDPETIGHLISRAL
jgi:hypothetical protein